MCTVPYLKVVVHHLKPRKAPSTANIFNRLGGLHLPGITRPISGMAEKEKAARQMLLGRVVGKALGLPEVYKGNAESGLLNSQPQVAKFPLDIK